MNKLGKILIVVVLIVAVGIVIAIKQKGKADFAADANLSTASAAPEAKASMSKQNDDAEKSNALPRLVDLGADKCIPCKMMAPILDELKEEYAGRLKVEFIDVWKNPDAGNEYGIKLIPTQIFYGASGKELFRHEGFFSKEDILSKWKEFGIDLTDSGVQLPTFERLTPAQPDKRPKDTVCYMCDRD
ncbi:thioredoxin family protein, partial [Planctomycetota bacterium]